MPPSPDETRDAREAPAAPAPPESPWISAERQKVLAYLSQQGCQHGGVGTWPALHLDECLAVWAVQSPGPGAEGRIGWWAISGDLPTDYMSTSSGTEVHPRAALRYFSTQWLEIADAMAAGTPRDGYMMSTPDDWPRLEPMLRSRAELIRDLAADDSLWEA